MAARPASIILLLAIGIGDLAAARRVKVNARFQNQKETAKQSLTNTVGKHMESASVERKVSVHVGSHMSSFLDAAAVAESGEWINHTTTHKCQVQAKEWRWFGTAPMCNGHRGRCTEEGMDFERLGVHGATCWKGQKVLCSKTKIKQADDCNIMCNPGVFDISMYGAAPKCGANACDCWKHGSIPIAQQHQYHCPCSDPSRCPDHLQHQGNAKCFSGKKQFCATPVGLEMTYQYDRISSCENLELAQLEHQKAAMDMVSNVAESGAKVAVAGITAR